jgi:hypothetical protein
MAISSAPMKMDARDALGLQVILESKPGDAALPIQD